MDKKTRRGLSGSLGTRVLLSSFLFLVIPLIIYSFFLYFIDYQNYKKDLFVELDLVGKEEVLKIQEQQTYNTITLNLINEFIFDSDKTDKLKDIDQLREFLKKFTKHKNINAIIFAKVSSNGKVVSKISTYSAYEGIDFTPYIPPERLQKNNIQSFIAKDPFYGYSMYDVKYIGGKGNNGYIIMTVTSLEKILSLIDRFIPIDGINLTIINQNGKVLVTTNSQFEGKRFSNSGDPGAILIRRLRYIDVGRTFSIKNKQYYIDIRKLGNDKYFLMCSVPKETVMNDFISFLYRISIFFILVLIFGGSLTYLFTLRMAKPIKNLGNVIDSIGHGKMDVSYKKDRFGFEINDLGEGVNQMQEDLVKYIDEVQNERGKKEAFKKELEIGHEIQNALLPSKNPQIPGVEIATYYSSATQVAGDFYDYIEIDNDKILITIADGVGKGISSCLYSFDLRSILRTMALSNDSLDKIATLSNSIFCEDTKDSCNFVTLVIGILDKTTQAYEFTNAGHLPVIVKRKNSEVQKYTTKGIAFGIEPIDSIEKETIQLEKGDFCILYTDGITEGLNEQESLYTEERLLQSIKQIQCSSSKEFSEKIIADLEAFVGKKEQYDDISLIVFRIQE